LLPQIELTTIDSKKQSLNDYEGKTLLIVNVASNCGFTPQYKDLQKLYEEFKDRGFEILAFPCNQFGGQEPGTGDQIASFCEMNYGVDFQLFEKTDVNGDSAHPLFNFLKSRAPGILGTESIKWNFTNFLVDKTGEQIIRYGSNDAISKIKDDLIKII
jgi:glutathione peroxidase